MPKKHALIKVSRTGTGTETTTTTTLYRTNIRVNGLAYKDDYLYGIAPAPNGTNRILTRIEISDLSPYTPAALLNLAEPPMNYWEVTKRNSGIRNGLAFHETGVAYGFSDARDEVRQARQPSPERLFALLPNANDPTRKTFAPRGLARIGDKWYVAGHMTGYLYIFDDDGFDRRIKSEGVMHSGVHVDGWSIRGLTTDGTNLIAVTGFAPRILTWAPQANESAPPLAAITTLTSPPAGGQYLADGIARDGANTWVAVSWPRTGPNAQTKHGLLKLSATERILYRTNTRSSGLARKNDGYLYGLAGDDLTRIKISALSPYTPAALLNLAEPPMNTWEVVKRDSGLSNGLAFHNGAAYGFNADHDEVRAERDAPTTAPASPSPAALPAGAVPPTGADPSAAASLPSNAANPSN